MKLIKVIDIIDCVNTNIFLLIQYPLPKRNNFLKMITEDKYKLIIIKLALII
jgi:hypothetical protein